MNNNEVDRGEILRAFSMVSMIGADLAGCTILGTFIGSWIDNHLGTKPWFLILGIILGLGGGIYSVVKLLESFDKKRKNKEDKK